MSHLPDLNSIKQEFSEQNNNSKFSNLKFAEAQYDDVLSKNLDFAESLQLLAKSGKLASSRISVKTKFDKKTTDILKNWLIKNIDNPYPSDETKDKLCEMTGLNKKQIQNWFTNTRKRYVQPLKRKLKNESLSNEFSSETGESQNDQDSISLIKSEDNLQKPQSISKFDSTAETPKAPTLINNTLMPQVFHSIPAPTLRYPSQIILPSLDGCQVVNPVAFGGMTTYPQNLHIPQMTYTNVLPPQPFSIDRNLLNIDQSSVVELQKEELSKKKSLREFMINESLKVALQVMRQEKLNKSQISTDAPSSESENEDTKQRNKQRRQDLEAYLNQITKKIHVA